ncbi:MAG: helix-turn-helix domain-containing protein [Muribaculaceae bacterium]
MGIDLISAICIIIINSIIVFILLRKAHGERTMILFACFALLYVCTDLYYIINVDDIRAVNSGPFSFAVLANGMVITVLFLVFPFEFILPQQIKKRWIYVLMLIPSLVYDGIWFTLQAHGMKVLEIDSPYMLLMNLSDASVSLRIIYFAYIMLLFAGVVVFVAIAHKRYMTDRVIRFYAYAAMPIMIIYIAIVFIGLTPEMYALHMLYIGCFNISMTYFLLHPDILAKKIEDNSEPENSSIIISHYDQIIIDQLNELMTEKKIYCQSELTLPKLASILGTNRTKLSTLIHNKGFSTFQSYLNTYRIKEFKRIIAENESDTIYEASYLAGFGSKASVYRCFMSVYGMSPSEYLKSKSISVTSEK